MNKTDDLFVQSLILLDRQKLMMDSFVENGRLSLIKFENSLENTGSVGITNVISVLNYAHGLIDHLVRFEKIARSVPKISQKGTEFRKFREAMGSLVDARNQIQHINRNTVNNYTGPLLGSVSWVSSGVNYTAGFSDVGRERSIPGLVYDTQEKRFLSEFCYVFGETYHDLGKAIAGVHRYFENIFLQVNLKVDGKPYASSNHLIALRYKIDLP
jgi:hypothetical protein